MLHMLHTLNSCNMKGLCNMSNEVTDVTSKAAKKWEVIRVPKELYDVLKDLSLKESKPIWRILIEQIEKQ